MDGASALGVMLVDDEEIDRRLCARVLKRVGHVGGITGYGYAADALAHLADPRNPPVDLILLDINMPAMNGFAFLDALAGMASLPHRRPAVALMLTTSLNPADLARATACDAVAALLDKPLVGAHVWGLLSAIAARTFA